MKRGPDPVKGYDAAIPAALRRGRVMRFRSSPEYAGNFLFYGNGLLVLVCLRLAVRLSRATLADISTDFTGAIAGLSTIPCGGPVSRELWLYTRHGRLRFFRLGSNGSLEEIDRDGMLFVNGKPVRPEEPAPVPARLKEPVVAANSPADSGSADTPAHVLRYLKKWNAMNAQAAEGGGATGFLNEDPVVAAPPAVPGSSRTPGDEGGGTGG